MMKLLVIYYVNCVDGFIVVWVVCQVMDVEFYFGVYGEVLLEVVGWDVILVDFCYLFDVLMQLGLFVCLVLVLDYYKLAEVSLMLGNCYVGQVGLVWVVCFDSLLDVWVVWDYYLVNVSVGSGIVCVFFDMSCSGVGIVWDFFYFVKVWLVFFDYVEDCDLWCFVLQYICEICVMVYSYLYMFQVWDVLVVEMIYLLYQQGLVLEWVRVKDVVEQVVLLCWELVIGNYCVLVVSILCVLVSEVGYFMGKGWLFVVCYYDIVFGCVFSLCFMLDVVDVSEVVVLYGGGGYVCVVGFMVLCDYELVRV